MAAQQNVDLAFAAAERTIAAGTAAIKIGGLQLKGELETGKAQQSLLSQEYQQRITEQERKVAELHASEMDIVGYTLRGGLAGLGANFYSSMGDFAAFALKFL